MTPKEIAEVLRREKAPDDEDEYARFLRALGLFCDDNKDTIIAALEAYDKKQWKHCGHDGFPKRGDEIVYGYYGKTGTWLWVAGVVDEHEDGFFVDFGEDGEDIKSDGYWMPVKPPTTERES